MALLEVENLHVTFRNRDRETRAVDGVSFSIGASETLAVVGESGCGKSVTSLAILGLLPKRGCEITGSVKFDGRELLALTDADMREVRGRDIAMVFQDPMTSLNPVLTIGRQLIEVLRRHFTLSRVEARNRATDLLKRVGFPDPEKRLRNYPHQLSGGLRQRAMIAMALACEPKLLIADEPTTALDVTIQAQILDLLNELVIGTQTALILITHDLGIVARSCERVQVMYSGRIVEAGVKHELFAHPRHPYTVGLLGSVPRLDQPHGERLQPIDGSPRDTVGWHLGCAFAPRCPNRIDNCISESPVLEVDPSGISSHLLRCVNPSTLSTPDSLPGSLSDSAQVGVEL